MNDSRSKRNMLIAAGVLLAVAVIWLVVLELTSSVRDVCDSINRFGYSVTPNDFYSQGYGTDTSIDELLDEDISTVVEQSRECGFPADTERIGKVELLLWNMDDERVMFVYTVDGEAELVFIQEIDTQNTYPIG